MNDNQRLEQIAENLTRANGETFTNTDNLNSSQLLEIIALATSKLAKSGGIEPEQPLNSTTEEYYYDEDLDLYLSSHIFSDGGAVQNNNASGWIRRFNGVQQSDTIGRVTNGGIVIVWVEFSCSNISNDVRTVEFRHYALFPDSENKRDFQLAKSIDIDQEQNTCGYVENGKILIPGRRRLAIWLSDSFFQPQLTYGYRRILGETSERQSAT